MKKTLYLCNPLEYYVLAIRKGVLKEGERTMARRVMSIEEIREESTYFLLTGDKSAGVMALVDVENMGWCKDGVTRWYTFTDENGEPAIYFKH